MICFVNKQIRSETLPLFYTGNVFQMNWFYEDEVKAVKRWLSTIEDYIKYLRWLKIHALTHVPNAPVEGGRLPWSRGAFKVSWEVDLREGNATRMKPKLEQHAGGRLLVRMIHQRDAAWEKCVKDRSGGVCGNHNLTGLVDDFLRIHGGKQREGGTKEAGEFLSMLLEVA
jgi:hypothetical protein